MHRRSICALALGAVLVVSAASIATVPGTSSAAGAAADEGESRLTGEATAAAATQTEGEAISALEAMRLVENQTEGLVVGVQRNWTDDGEDGPPVYEVPVVQGNPTGDQTQEDRRVLMVRVHATNETILGTETLSEDVELFDTEDDELEDIAVMDSLNMSTARSAVNATEIGINQSEQENLTVNEVRLTLRDHEDANASTPPLVYRIDVENVEGGQVVITVSAREGEEGVITVEPQSGDDGGAGGGGNGG